MAVCSSVGVGVKPSAWLTVRPDGRPTMDFLTESWEVFKPLDDTAEDRGELFTAVDTLREEVPADGSPFVDEERRGWRNIE